MILVRFLVNIYYVVICGWCFIYLGNQVLHSLSLITLSKLKLETHLNGLYM